jgi:hypothetical protein
MDKISKILMVVVLFLGTFFAFLSLFFGIVSCENENEKNELVTYRFTKEDSTKLLPHYTEGEVFFSEQMIENSRSSK